MGRALCPRQLFSEADPNTFCMYAERVKAQETELSEVDRMFQPGCGKRVKAQETEPRRINAKSFRFRRMYELSKGELPGGAKGAKVPKYISETLQKEGDMV